MSSPAGIVSGMTFLPNWLQDTKDANAWDTLMGGWVRASRWRTAGVIWPTETQPTLAFLARAESVEPLPALPAELPDVVRALKSGQSTVVWQIPGSAGRLYTLLQPTGRPSGVIWAERGPTEPWTELDRSYLILAVRMIERSPAFLGKIGPMLDPDRLVQRLQDASVIAGRMAHDFDNILTGIIGFSDLSAPLLGSVPQAAKFVSEIGKVGQRGIQFTQQLHQLSRSGQVKPQPCTLAAALAKEESRIRNNNPSGVQVISNLPGSLVPVGLDLAPLGTILGHLLDNALEASPPAGRILVNAKVAELSLSEARSYLGPVNPGTHVEVTIQDFGPGIRSDVRTKLFTEPFFTTKVRHRGLGLAIVYRTLHCHGGGIRIDSANALETGTTVRVVLPPAPPRPAPTTRPLTHANTFGG
jgi:signal transduction histidine kinase